MTHSSGAHPRRKQSIYRLFNEQSGLCAYCGKEMTLHLGKPNTITRDHVIPRSKGGPTEAWNLYGACLTCNSRKGDKPLIAFLAIITDGRPEEHPLYRRSVVCQSKLSPRRAA